MNSQDIYCFIMALTFLILIQTLLLESPHINQSKLSCLFKMNPKSREKRLDPKAFNQTTTEARNKSKKGSTGKKNLALPTNASSINREKHSFGPKGYV